MTMHPHEQEIINAAARAIFVQWWADQCACGSDAENCRLEGDGDPDWDPTLDHTPNDEGGELMDYALETPDVAVEAAKMLFTTIEGINRKPLLELYDEAAANPSEHRKDPTREDFGHYIAMSAIGHGVAWDDDHPTRGIEGPELRFYGDSYEVDVRFISRVA